MEIKNPFNQQKKQEVTHRSFLSVEISPQTVKSAVWTIENDQGQIVNLGTVEDWSGTEIADLVTAVDASLSKAFEAIDPEPNEVLFGLPETWVSKEGIQEKKKPFLKAISEKLDLKAVGFVVTTEAMVQYLNKSEGTPLSAVLISCSETELVMNLVYNGEIKSVQIVGRSQDIVSDLQEGIARFNQTASIPSRIILYDGNSDLEALKQDLLNFEWERDISFLHVPKIETLATSTSITAISISAGVEVAKSLGISIAAPLSESSVPEYKHQKDQELKETVSPNEPDFGFEDITNFHEDNSPALEITSEHENVIPVSFSSDFEADSVEIDDDADTEPKKSKFPKLQIKPKRFLSFFMKKKILGLVILFFILSLGLAFAYYEVPKANVTIFVSPQTFSKELEFKLDPEIESVKLEESLVPAQATQVQISGSKEIDVTGEKTVGEKAKGIVTIFNKTNSKRTFEEGTILSVNKAQFTLDSSVTIASASSKENLDFTTVITPSSEDVSVSAIEIGDSYNTPRETQLNVANFAQNSFVAKAKTDLSGGSSKKITAVSAQDRKKLQTELTNELNEKIKLEIENKKNTKTGIVEISSPEIVSLEFSAAAGDEADKLKLTMEQKVPIYTFQLEGIAALAKNQNLSVFPQGYDVDEKRTKIDILETKVSGQIATIKALVNLGLIPKFNRSEIITSIQGKTMTYTESYFKALPNFVKVESDFNVNLPQSIKTFPHKKENIEVNVEIVQ